MVLDEPTNHLDIWARDALEGAIKNFDGTVLVVSHDRYFLNQAADHLLVFEPDRVRLVEGNYEAYQQLLSRKSEERPDKEEASEKRKTGKSKQKPTKSRKKAVKKRRFPYRKVADLEDEIFIRETLVQEYHKELALPESMRNGDRIKLLMAKIAEEQEALKTLYEHWNEATELNW